MPTPNGAKLRTFVSAVLFIAFLGATASADRLRYLPLQSPGQASVAIDQNKGNAYIIDLGKAGDGDKILITQNGKDVPLLDYLAEQKISRLVFSCSHPHADHMGGIRALFSNPRNFYQDEQLTRPRFASVSVIDDGVSDSLFQILKKALPTSTSLKVEHLAARNRNAFAGLSNQADDVFIENIPYSVEAQAGVHGRSVVTRVTLGGKYTIIDFDDADTAIIPKVVAELERQGVAKINAFVAPHHGSAYHDIEPIFRLHPDQAIIAVNPANRYGHPAPPILRALMEKLNPENVFFTGSEGRLEFGPEGPLEATFSAASRDSYELFVLPNRLRDARRGILKNEADYKYIQSAMLRDPGSPPPAASSGGSGTPPTTGPGPGKSPIVEAKIGNTNTLLSPEFDVGAIPRGGSTPETLVSRKIFKGAQPGNQVADIPISADFSDGSDRIDLAPEESQAVLDHLSLTYPDQTPETVRVSLETDAGLANGLEPSREIPTSRLRTSATKVARTAGRLPHGGMVFLSGGKIFTAGAANELLGSTIDICGERLCIHTSSGSASDEYQLPISPNPMFWEVWERVYQRHIDTFYLSINPTKAFLRKASLEEVPSEKLVFGEKANPTAPNVVVTAGDIDGTNLGRILWESDVVFKSASLGFDVLKGGQPDPLKSYVPLVREAGMEDSSDLHVETKDRWCRLYWTSGSQTINADPTSKRVTFAGNAVLAKSEPMILENGELKDYPKGSWCDDAKQVARRLQAEANGGEGARPILQELRQLAETQNFVRWAREHGIVPSASFKSAAPSAPSRAFLMPRWTSGIRSEAPMRVQKEVKQQSNTYLVHFSVADAHVTEKCVLPYWDARGQELPKLGLHQVKGVWEGNGSNHTFSLINEWMTDLSKKIAQCANGALLPSVVETGLRRTSLNGPDFGANPYLFDGPDNDDAESLAQMRREGEFGLVPHLESVSVHGGVLLGSPRTTLESSLKDASELVSPRGGLLYQRDGPDLHFWNLADPDSDFGSIGQHIYIHDGTVTSAHLHKGRLRLLVETKPGSVVRDELRISRAMAYPQGIEWLEARHGEDGTLILNKSAWPCGVPQSGSNCIASADVDAKSLGAIVGAAAGKREPLITAANIDHGLWIVDLDLTSLKGYFDERWQQTAESDLDQRLSLAHEYARWGFEKESAEKYDGIKDSFEKDSEDTILAREEFEDDAINEFLAGAISKEQEQIDQGIGLLSLYQPGVLIEIKKLDPMIAKLTPEVESDLWEEQAQMCGQLEKFHLSPVEQKRLAAEEHRYHSLALRTRALAGDFERPWGSSPDSQGAAN